MLEVSNLYSISVPAYIGVVLGQQNHVIVHVGLADALFHGQAHHNEVILLQQTAMPQDHLCFHLHAAPYIKMHGLQDMALPLLMYAWACRLCTIHLDASMWRCDAEGRSVP